MSSIQSVPDYLNSSVPIDRRLADLLSRMTVDEKIHQLQSQLLFNPGVDERKYEVGHIRALAHFLHKGSGRKKPSECAAVMNEDQRRSIERNRLGIPVLINCEALHGAQWGDATCFPQAIGLAATWNTDLMEKTATAIALELRAVGVRQVFAPVINIARDPRWGRAQETYGEDPYLASRMAVTYVRALKSHNVIATPKHFAANFSDGGRDSNAVNLSWRILREIYFPAFKACIREGGAMSIMPAYNSIDGLPCSCNKDLLMRILRDEWGFKGFTVSDYGAVEGIYSAHCMVESYDEAVKLAIEAGMDVELANGGHRLPELVKNGMIAQEVIDAAASRVLRAKMEIGLFEEPYADTEQADRVVHCAAHVNTALQAARESMVLLKNECNILPLNKNIGTIGIFGPTKDVLSLGDYSGPFGGWGGEGITPLQGIREIISSDTRVLIHNEGEDPSNIARKCDAAIIFTAVYETEGGDRCNLGLPENELSDNVEDINKKDHALIVDPWQRELGHSSQIQLINSVTSTGVPTIVVLINGSAVTMSEWIGNVQAIVEAWYPGEQGGRAIAEVLFGEYNPGGKLPVTFPKTVGQLPLYYNYKPSGRSYGYNDCDGDPMFPFGYGLSFTSFEYTNLYIGPVCYEPDINIRIRADIKNTGPCKGDEVVQLYIGDKTASVVRPFKELKGFRRITLDPGEKKSVDFILTADELSLWDKNMEFVVEPGVFKVMIGSSSMDIRLEGEFIVEHI